MQISHITYSNFCISRITIARYRQATVATQRAFRFFAIFLYLFINYATGNRQVIIIFIIIAQLIYLILITYFRRQHHVKQRPHSRESPRAFSRAFSWESPRVGPVALKPSVSYSRWCPPAFSWESPWECRRWFWSEWNCSFRPESPRAFFGSNQSGNSCLVSATPPMKRHCLRHKPKCQTVEISICAWLQMRYVLKCWEIHAHEIVKCQTVQWVVGTMNSSRCQPRFHPVFSTTLFL